MSDHEHAGGKAEPAELHARLIHRINVSSCLIAEAPAFHALAVVNHRGKP